MWCSVGLFLLLGTAAAWSLRRPALPAEDAATPRTAQLDTIRIPGSRINIGSDLDEIVLATDRCSIEAREACSVDEYASELKADQPTPIGSFFIDRTEVSVAKYERCVMLGECKSSHGDQTTDAFLDPRVPVVLVSLLDAQSYCAHLGGRVPTEAEFELAAAGPLENTYPWGNLFHSRLSNFGARRAPFTDQRDGFELLAPVDAFTSGSSRHGILQLAGNAAEWTTSPFLPHGDAEAPSSRAPRQVVVKGGSFRSLPIDQRAHARRAMLPSSVAVDVGFRCIYSQLSNPQL